MRISIHTTWSYGAAVACALAVAAHGARAEPKVAGWIENAWLNGTALSLKAKLDTGAKSSSINAPEYTKFERDGKKWVRFKVTNSDGKSLDIEAPVVRVARIRRSGVKTAERPVIVLPLCVAGKRGDAEFTLADRTGMNYQLLIGRTFMADRILVDSRRTNIGTGECAKP